MCSQEPSVLKSWPQKTDSEDSKTQVFIKGEWLKKNEKGRIVMKSRKDRKQRRKWTKVRKVLLEKNKNGEQRWETPIAHIRFIPRCPSYYSNLWEGPKHSHSLFPSFLSLVFMPSSLKWNIISEISMPAMDCLLEPSLVPNYQPEATHICSTMAMFSSSTNMVVSVLEGSEAPWELSHLHCCPNKMREFLFCWGLLHLSSFSSFSSYPWLLSLPLFHRSIQSDISGSHMLTCAKKILGA